MWQGERVWQEMCGIGAGGACMTGGRGMHGGGLCMVRGGGVAEADSAHPTGKHSCMPCDHCIKQPEHW